MFELNTLDAALFVGETVDFGTENGILEEPVQSYGSTLLGDLEACGQIGVEIVFALKIGDAVYVAIEGQSCEKTGFHASSVQSWHGSGESAVEMRCVHVGPAHVGIRSVRVAEDLGSRMNSRVDLEANLDP